MSYYKKGYNPNERYIHIAEDGSDIYQDTETMEILSDYVILERLNKQDDEIRELQERNDRQRKRLDNLYQLILNRDYTGQEELIKELEESERLLQEEMKLYCK